MFALAGSALADGYSGSIKDAPVAPARTFSYSVNAAVTTDYIFRGISQSSESPALSAGFDASYGILYAGFWGSNIDFDGIAPDGSIEMDVYAGIKPVLGPVTFDFAVLGYLYPNSDNLGGDEVNYLELKAGASITPFTNASLGVAVYYSPDFTGNFDEGVAVEGSAGYTFASIGRFTPSVSGLIGYQTADTDPVSQAGFEDEYTYWNVGASVAFDKFTLDVRYWDTDIEADSAFPVGETYADERVVGTIKVLLP
jgi:uncharacterized protein (TIGR02001 family)